MYRSNCHYRHGNTGGTVRRDCSAAVSYTHLGKGWRRFWYDLHVAGGMYTLIFLLAMALTGLTWSFSWYRTGFYKVFGVETMQGGGGHGAQAQTAAHGGDRAQGRSGGENRERKPFSPFANWQKVYEELKELSPDYKQITVSRGSATAVSYTHLFGRRAVQLKHLVVDGTLFQ